MNACTPQTKNNSSIQTVDSTIAKASNEQLIAAYTQAIAQYVEAIKQQPDQMPDTLYIGQHPDFPNIVLPTSIEGQHIRQITYDEYARKVRPEKQYTYLNIMSWIQKQSSDFLLVTFYDQGRPQHNLHIRYTNQEPFSQFVLDSLWFENPYKRKK